MADTKLQIFQADGSTAAIDYRSESTNGDGRQVVVLGDPSVNNNVADVVTSDPGPSSNAPGVVFRLAGSASVKIVGASGTIGVYLDSTQGTIRTKLDPASVLSGITSSIAVYFDRAKPTIFSDAYHTASIFTVSGSTSGVSPSGVQLVAPSSSYSYKVFAFSLQTTGIVSVVARFTNGGGSATEFWRGLVTANQTSSAPVGANLAVPPPAYLFATGTSTTLALHLDTATLVHYSVSYIKESA